MITGPDISAAQRGIDLGKIRAAGHSFVIVKATEGTGFVSPVFRDQTAQAKAAGLVTSAYHFMAQGNGAAQGQHFLDTIAGVIDPAVRVWADFESSKNSTPSHDDLHAFLTVVGSVRPVGIYTGGWYWAPHGDSGCQHCAGLPLWLSGYTAQQPATPRPWQSTALWQYTNQDPAYPGGPDVDMSRTADLSALLTNAPEDDMFTDADRADLQTAKDFAIAAKNNTDFLPQHRVIVESGLGVLLGRTSQTVTAADIAAAIPASIAADVAAEIAKRLAADPA